MSSPCMRHEVPYPSRRVLSRCERGSMSSEGMCHSAKFLSVVWTKRSLVFFPCSTVPERR